MAALEGKTECHVTSPAGTDVRVSIEGRPALEVTSIKRRGQMMGPLPLWAEVAFAAVEDRTEGTIVVDGVMLGIGLAGQVTEPITWKMENGHAVSIEGGDDAARLREVIEGVENADVAGEFAFGVSEVAPFGTPSEKGRVGHRPLRARRQPPRLPGRPERLQAAPRRGDPRGEPADRRRRHLHRQGRGVGAVSADHRGRARERRADRAARRQLEPDAGHRRAGRRATPSSIGYSVFKPGSATTQRLARDRGGRLRGQRLRAARHRRRRGPLRGRRRAPHPAPGPGTRSSTTRTPTW